MWIDLRTSSDEMNCCEDGLEWGWTRWQWWGGGSLCSPCSCLSLEKSCETDLFVVLVAALHVSTL